MDNRIWVDRTEHNLGDMSSLDGETLRRLVAVPDTRDIWQQGRTPIDPDRKVEPGETVFLGSGMGIPPRFFTAPKHINASAPAVRRVAPDRETVERIIHEWARFDGSLDQLTDRLLASGVLGVPADQRTADRETIARALFETRYRADDVGNVGNVVRRNFCLDEADAVLAVLVPADQVRAETLEALRRDLREADQTPWHVLDTIEARAAEYRKAAAA